MENITPLLLTAQETADILRVSLITIRRWTASGQLPSRHLGRSVRFLRSDIEELIGGTASLGASQGKGGAR